MATKKAGLLLIFFGAICLALFLTIIFFYDFNLGTGIIALIGLGLLHSGIAVVNYSLPLDKRKRNSNRIIIIAIILLLVGLFFKMNHWLGARILIIESIFLQAFSYAPIIVKSRYDKWRGHTKDNILSILLSFSDFVGVLCVLMGLLSKLQHWPGGNFLIVFGTASILLALIGWNYVFKKEVVLRKLAEEKLNDIYLELETKHKIIEEKQKEILDSIHYAKRIQQSILPNENYIKRTLQRLNKYS